MPFRLAKTLKSNIELLGIHLKQLDTRDVNMFRWKTALAIAKRLSAATSTHLAPTHLPLSIARALHWALLEPTSATEKSLQDEKG